MDGGRGNYQTSQNWSSSTLPISPPFFSSTQYHIHFSCTFSLIKSTVQLSCAPSHCLQAVPDTTSCITPSLSAEMQILPLPSCRSGTQALPRQLLPFSTSWANEESCDLSGRMLPSQAALLFAKVCLRVAAQVLWWEKWKSKHRL